MNENIHSEFYKTICQPNFTEINNKLDSICNLLKGSDGDPGLCELHRNLSGRVNNLEEVDKRKKAQSTWLVRTFIGAVIVQAILIMKTIGKEFIEWTSQK